MSLGDELRNFQGISLFLGPFITSKVSAIKYENISKIHFQLIVHHTQGGLHALVNVKPLSVVRINAGEKPQTFHNPLIQIMGLLLPAACNLKTIIIILDFAYFRLSLVWCNEIH